MALHDGNTLNRRAVLALSSRALCVSPLYESVLLGQAAPQPSPVRRPLPLAEVAYVQDGTEIRMRVSRRGDAKDVLIEIIFTEGKNVIAVSKTSLVSRSGALGTLGFEVSGQTFVFALRIDGSQVRLRDGQPPEGTLKVLIQHGKQKFEGSFDPKTGASSGLERARGLELPTEIAVKLDPFQEILRVSIQDEWKRAGSPPPEQGKPPARLWTGSTCRMACSGATTAASLVAAAATAGALAVLAAFAIAAASSYCSDRCPA